MTLQEFAPIGALFFLSLVIAVIILTISRIFGPHKPTSRKAAPYESGMKPFSPRPARFNFRYYYYALLFVVFDVETVLLYPWAVKYGALSAEFGWFALGAVFVFLFIATDVRRILDKRQHLTKTPHAAHVEWLAAQPPRVPDRRQIRGIGTRCW